LKFTIFGASGFIGSNLAEHFKKEKIDFSVPDIRKEDILNNSLGHVIYSIGVSDFLQRPYDAVEAHVCILRKLLQYGKFDSLLYISSGRIYYNGTSTNEEDSLIINPLQTSDLYNISKVMGESLCVASRHENIRIVRPSNVTGNNITSNLFIPSILRDAVDKKIITLHSTLDSEKDYVYIDDVITILPKIALHGKHKVYNLAFGKNITNKEIVEEISRVTNCKVQITSDAKRFSYPNISITRIQNEFGYKPVSIIPKLEKMIASYKNSKNNSCK